MEDQHGLPIFSEEHEIGLPVARLGAVVDLRGICGGLACCEGKLRHLGVPEAPKRSTLRHTSIG